MSKLRHNERRCTKALKVQLNFQTIPQLREQLNLTDIGLEGRFCHDLFSLVRNVSICEIGLVERIMSVLKDLALSSLSNLTEKELFSEQNEFALLCSKVTGISYSLAASGGKAFINLLEEQLTDDVHQFAHSIQRVTTVPADIVMSWFGFSPHCSYEGSPTQCEGEIKTLTTYKALEIAQSASKSANQTEKQGFYSTLALNKNLAYCEHHLAEYLFTCVFGALAKYIPQEGDAQQQIDALKSDPVIEMATNVWTTVCIQILQKMPGFTPEYIQRTEQQLQKLINDKWAYWEYVLRLGEKLTNEIFSPEEEERCPEKKELLKGISVAEACLESFEFLQPAKQSLLKFLSQIAGQQACAFHTMKALDEALTHAEVIGHFPKGTREGIIHRLRRVVFVALAKELCPNEKMLIAVLSFHTQMILENAGILFFHVESQGPDPSMN